MNKKDEFAVKEAEKIIYNYIKQKEKSNIIKKVIKKLFPHTIK